MNELLKILTEIANRLVQDKAIQEEIISAIHNMLTTFWRPRSKRIAAELSGGEITELTEELRSTLKQHVKEVDAVFETCQQIQKMFNVSGITESTVNEAKTAIRHVNNININLNINIEDPIKLKGINLNPLKIIVNGLSNLLKKIENLNDINPIQDQLIRIEEEISYLLEEFQKNIDSINKILKILFLSADPRDRDLGKLRLNKEVKDIEQALILSKGKEKFVIENKGAVELEDIPMHILVIKPDIVHISAHGKLGGNLILENKSGESVYVGTDLLESIFRVNSEGIHLVIINACRSDIQAKIIAKYIDYAIGMKEDISDDAAIAFSVGFYQAFGADKGVKRAFDNGCLQIQLKNLQEQHIPSIFVKAPL